jgi:hypothetical protein
VCGAYAPSYFFGGFFREGCVFLFSWRGSPARRATERSSENHRVRSRHASSRLYEPDACTTHHTQRDHKVNDEFSKKAIPKGISIDVSVSVNGGDTPFASPFSSPGAAALGEESEDGRQIRRRARAVRQMMMSGRCVSARLAQLRLVTADGFNNEP